MSAERRAAWLEAVRRATGHLRLAPYPASVGDLGPRADLEDMSSEPVAAVVKSELSGATVWVGFPEVANAIFREALDRFVEELLQGTGRVSSLEAREAALRAAGRSAHTMVVEQKLAQLCSTTLAVIDVIA